LDQWLILSPLVAVLSSEGHVWEQSLSSQSAAASCQFTVAIRIRQGIARLFSPARSCNACDFSWHLLTVKMRSLPAGDVLTLCFDLSSKKCSLFLDFLWAQ
jgi:hypothetical protein